MTLEVEIGTADRRLGLDVAAGWESPLNRRLGLDRRRLPCCAGGSTPTAASGGTSTAARCACAPSSG